MRRHAFPFRSRAPPRLAMVSPAGTVTQTRKLSAGPGPRFRMRSTSWVWSPGPRRLSVRRGSMTRFGRRGRMLASSVSLAGTESGFVGVHPGRHRQPLGLQRPQAQPHGAALAHGEVAKAALGAHARPAAGLGDRGAQRLGAGAAAAGCQLDVGGRRGAVVDHPQAPGAGNAHGVRTAGRTRRSPPRRRSARVAAGAEGSR